MSEKCDRALAGRTAIVTGGMRGIGRAVALGFADRGANVAIVDRDAADAPQVTAAHQAIESVGGALLYLQSDVTSEAEVRGFVARVAERFGTVGARQQCRRRRATEADRAGVAGGMDQGRQPEHSQHVPVLARSRTPHEAAAPRHDR